MFEQDYNDIVDDAHLYSWKRFLVITSTAVIPCEHPLKQCDPYKRHFTKYMQDNSKAKQSTVKLFVHSSIYYLMFASKILFKCCSDQLILVFKLRQTFLHFRNFQETQLNLPTLLDLSQMTKERMYLEMRKDKILFLPSSSKRFQITHMM